MAKTFEQVTPGQPEVCWITGPGGIGKTRVVSQALVDRAASSRDLMVYGRSYDCESVPYGGVDAALDRLTRDLPAMVTDDPAIAAAVALFPVLKTRVTATEAPQLNDRARAFAGVRTLLAKAAGGRQLILFLDDIERAGDDTAALLLDLLLPRDDELKLVIVATVRCDHGRHPWLDRIHERATTRGQSLVETDLSLGPLDSAACEALVRSVSEDPAFDYSEIAADAGGSPLVAELLARHGP
ncbi:MAG: AAA family ATPase [Nannocystaceae bacterium]